MLTLFILLLIAFLYYIQDKFIFKNNKIFTLISRMVLTLFLSVIFYSLITNKLFFSNDDMCLKNLICILINNIFNIFYYNKKFSKNKILKFYNITMKILSVILFLELTIFNYKHYITLFNKKNLVDNVEMINLTKIDDKYYVGTENGKSGFKINIKNINVKSFYFNIEKKHNINFNYNIYVLDNDSGDYIFLNQGLSCKNIKQSHYKTMYNTYDSDILYINFDNKKGDKYTVDNIILNVNIPMNISLIRVFILFIIAEFIYMIRPNSFIYELKVIDNKKMTFKIFYISFFIFSFISLIFIHTNSQFTNNHYEGNNINQYQSLSESFKNRHLYLEQDVNEKLINLKNPYNTYNREKQVGYSNYIWDAAYFNDHYYVYFGVVPVVLIYFPFYMITGYHISNIIVTYIGIIFIIISVLFLMRYLIYKYFKNVTIGQLILMIMFLLFSNHFIILYPLQRPDFYNIPILYGIMFSLIGINLYIRVKDKNYSKKYMFWGSFSIALVAGCRPQLFLVSFISIILFKDIFKDKKIDRKDKIKLIISFFIPYVVVAIMLMTYNYLRFKSIFDFGAYYNLTVDNLTTRGFNIERIGLGLFNNLFLLPNLTSVFPFIEMIDVKSSYIGITIYEKMFGGIFGLCPLLILNLFVFKFKKIFKFEKMYYISIISNLSVLLIIIINTNIAGIIPRYMLDYNWILAINFILIFLNILNYYNGNKPLIELINKVFFYYNLIFILLNIFMLFIDTSYQYSLTNPKFFYTIYYLIQFWL